MNESTSTATELRYLTQAVTEVKSRVTEIESRIEQIAQPAPPRPPLPDLSKWPGYVFRMEDGREAFRKASNREWYWSRVADGPRLWTPPDCTTDDYHILTYIAPPDVPPNERWWDTEEREWWTVEETYVLGRKPTPRGRELTGEFRPMKPGEECLGVDGGIWKRGAIPDVPRLILKPQPRELRLIKCGDNEIAYIAIGGVRYKLAEAK